MTSPSDEFNVALERLVLWHRAVPHSASADQARAWAKAVATRLEVAGGALVMLAGSGVAAVLDAMEGEDAVDLALGLLADAAKDAQGIDVAIGLAAGELSKDELDGRPQGAAIDRAQLLANCARPGELLLDEATAAQVEDSLLFGRTLRIGAITAHVLDVRHPRKRDCREAMQALLPPMLAPEALVSLEQLRTLAQKPGPRGVVLRASQLHAALDWLACLHDELSPKLLLHIGPQAGALQPLGGLQLALRRIQSTLALTDAPLRARVEACVRGAALSRAEVVLTLRELLTLGGTHPFVVIERVREVDSTTLMVLAEAIEQHASEPLVWVLGGEPTGVLAAVLLAGELHEVTIEGLNRMAATGVAASVLPSSRPEVARRVAMLAADSVPDIVEAARTLICSGDLVLEDDEFRFRTEPRIAAVAIPLEAWLTERASGLDAPARRMLEALSISPRAMGSGFVREMALLDGLSDDATAKGLEQLTREGWLETGRALDPLQQAIRNALRNAMPPSRAAELHRFAADVLALRATKWDVHGFGSALVAYHLAEGGREREAAIAVLDTADAATEAGFSRTAVQLAALARKLDSSPETQQRARAVARNLDSKTDTRSPVLSAAPRTLTDPPSTASVGPDARQIAAAAIAGAIVAIRHGQFDIAENAIDTAVAAGWGRAGAARLLSIAQLIKGDVPAAVRTLKQGHLRNADHTTRSREAIAATLILLAANEPLDAVRSGLEALASARKALDAKGEQASLRVLASCYSVLGRGADAIRIYAVASATS